MKVQLRDPNTIMKLSRLGSFHQSKLSFLRSFLNEFKDWEYKRDLFNLDKFGYGEAVYSFRKDKRTYSLVCFANEIKDNERSDRVIATKWDAAFTLHDGVPTQKDIDRLKNEVPKQEVGRLSFKELTLSRANKSVRVFNHVVEKLSEGKQPDLELLSKVGYLYRTTAVYGSGKFGLADRFRIKNREEINGPFRLEMMLVYLVRQFTFDQVNHVAHHKNPDNQPPEKIINWMNNHMKGFTGICNVQYRGQVIIEVALRCARGGAYILNTKNKQLIKSINELCDDGTWDYNNTKDLRFEPYYSFKCFTTIPILYLYPQQILDLTMKLNGCLEFYEYYFEPSGKDGMVFLQFLHKDFNTGLKLKSAIEYIFSFTQIIFLVLFFTILICYAFKIKNRFKILLIIMILFSTRFINAIFTNYTLIKTQKLLLVG